MKPADSRAGRRSRLGHLAACAIALPLGSCADHRPLNVVLVTLDTLRADQLGCYGAPLGRTPFLDEVARQGVLFEQAIAQAAVTPVSHASILTGLDPPRHGLRSMHGGPGDALPAARWTLAELLAAEGYRTAAFVSAFPVTRHYGLDQGFITWDQAFDHSDGVGLVDERGIVDTGRAQRRGDETTRRALEWLQGGDGTPFFLWVHYFDVHDPILLPPAEFLGARGLPASPPRGAGLDLLRALYVAEVSWVDAQVGQLLGGLAEAGFEERTVVAIVADHGQGLGDHAWWGHVLLYQEQIRVPMLLRIPGGPRDLRVANQVRTTDLVPSLVEILGLTLRDAPTLDGRSLLPLLEGRDRKPRWAYSESLGNLVVYPETPLAGESLHSLLDGRFKLIVHRHAERRSSLELFDLAADPRETRNLWHEDSAVAARLLRELERRRVFAPASRAAPLDPLARERLHALGYVQ